MYLALPVIPSALEIICHLSPLTLMQVVLIDSEIVSWQVTIFQCGINGMNSVLVILTSLPSQSL